MKLKALILFILLIVQKSCVSAQVNELDSVKLFVLSLDQDTNSVKILLNKSHANLTFRPLMALYFSQECIKLSEKLKYTHGEIMGLGSMGNALDVLGNYPEALKVLLKALKKAEISNNPYFIYAVLSNIGSNYKLQQDHNNAITYFIKSKEIVETLNRKNDLAGILLNISDSYKELSILDSARIYSQQAYELSIKLNNPQLSGLIFSNMGGISYRMEQFIIALEYYRLGLHNFKKTLERDEVCETTLGMAKVFKELNLIDSCLYYARLSMTIAKDCGSILRIFNTSKFLADYYMNINIDSAYTYQTYELNTKDSLFNQQRSRLLLNLTLNEAFRQEENMREINRSSQELKTNIQYTIILVGIIILSIFFLLISRSFTVGEKLIKFLGVLVLLFVFEFIDLVIHSYLGKITNYSPFFMLLTLVVIAAILIPIHQKIENRVTKYLITIKKKKIEKAQKVLSSLTKKGNLE